MNTGLLSKKHFLGVLSSLIPDVSKRFLVYTTVSTALTQEDSGYLDDNKRVCALLKTVRHWRSAIPF